MIQANRYNVVKTSTATDLEIEVEILLKDGWFVQGGIASDGEYFYQAMVRP